MLILRLTHSIAHDDLVQDNVIFFFSVDLESMVEKIGILTAILLVVACHKSGIVIGEFDKHNRKYMMMCTLTVPCVSEE